MGAATDRRDLDYDNNTRTLMPELELSYVEPIGENWAVQIRNTGSYTFSKTDKAATDINDA